MSDDLSELKQKLERATAPAGVAAPENENAVSDRATSDFDPQTAALRDAWLAFGRLLESADAAGEVMPTIAFPREASSPPIQRTTTVRAPKRWRWLPAALFVAAASLAAAVVTVGLRSSSAPRNATPSPDVAVKPIATPTTAVAGIKKPAAVAPSAEWDDPDDKKIGEEITAIQLDISLTQRKWDRQGDASQAIEYRINQDEQEVDQGPL